MDGNTGQTVSTAAFEPCEDESFTVTTLTAAGQFFGDGPDNQGENLCNIVPVPSGTTGWGPSVSGPQCLDPVVGNPTVTWTSVSGVEFEYGNPPRVSGGVFMTFSSPDLGTVTWANTGQIDPGTQLLSNALTAGRRVLLTYLSGPLGSSPSGSVRIISNSQVWFHQNATIGTAPPIRVRFDILQP
ncbi:hypothetical protein ABZ543_08085 [Streptomyces roseifaciens]